LNSAWKSLTFVCCTKAYNLEACAYVCFSLSYTELTADQFSARVVCQSTDYSSMWCAQRTFPLTVALTRLEDAIGLHSDSTRLVEGQPDSSRDSADETNCGAHSKPPT